MANFHDEDGLLGIVHGINNTIGALPYPVAFLAGEFIATFWPGVFCQCQDALHNPPAVFLITDSVDIFDGRGFDEQLIFGHYA